jgi:hypothetical protein
MATKPFNGRLGDRCVNELLNSEDPDIVKKALTKLIGLKNVTPRLLESFMDQGITLSGVPQLGMTAAVAGALATYATREILLGRKIDSGRYIFSPKKTLGLQSPTPARLGAQTILKFVKSAKG